jgi:hypothetical protein
MSNVIYTSSISEFNKLSDNEKESFDRVIIAKVYGANDELPSGFNWEPLPILSPAYELLNSWINDTISWDEYASKYNKDKKDNINYRRALVTIINEVVSGKKIVILCNSIDCHDALIFDNMNLITGDGLIRKEIGGK